MYPYIFTSFKLQQRGIHQSFSRSPSTSIIASSSLVTSLTLISSS